MKFIFIDEVEQLHRKPNFFAVSILVVDSRFYEILKESVDKALERAEWRREEEFKGRYIFSSSKGDTTVAIDGRIELVRSIVAQTTAKKNARARFYFAYNERGKTANNYLELVAKAMIGPADRFVDTRHEGQHVGGRFDPGLDDGEFVAAESRNQIARLEAGADAARDRLQQLVADMVAERIVDALELVDVDIEQRELLAACDLLQLAFDLRGLSEFEQAQSDLVGKAVILTDGMAGTVEGVWLDELHGLRISIRGHDGKWPVSTIKFAQTG